MNTRDDWPLPEEMPQWWRDRPLTAEQIEQMREEYEREQISSAQSEQDAAAWAAHYSKK